MDGTKIKFHSVTSLFAIFEVIFLVSLSIHIILDQVTLVNDDEFDTTNVLVVC